MITGPRRIVYPLDYPTLAEARAGAALVAPAVGVLKVGLQLFTREGPAAVHLGQPHGREIFLDLKLHDIPQTVEGAVASAAALGVRYLTIHASGGKAMLEKAANAAAKATRPLTLLAVTMLTSLDASDLWATGVAGTPAEHVVRLAKLAWDSGIKGFVASPDEARSLRDALGREPLIVTPGIRPAGTATGDQKRVSTPASAIGDGADLLVIGRPIKDAADPFAAAKAIGAEIEKAERARDAWRA